MSQKTSSPDECQGEGSFTDIRRTEPTVKKNRLGLGNPFKGERRTPCFERWRKAGVRLEC